MPEPAFDSRTATGSSALDTGTGTTAGAAWAQAAIVLGARADAATADGADLDSRYAQPHRHYHHGGHITAVLLDAGLLAAELGLTREDHCILILAACAHDVVYDAHPGADERASAEWARARLEAAGAEQYVAHRVCSLVLATIDHVAPPEDLIADALLDADLAILAAPQQAYATYVQGVRAEYAAVSDADWRAGRAAVLSGLSRRPDLYRSEPARRRWADAARANITAELAGLEPA